MLYGAPYAHLGIGTAAKIKDMYVKNVESIMILKYLSLEKLADVAYWCGMDNTPIFLYFAGDTGCGKTWSTEALSETPFVMYLNKVYSPKEHRSIIGLSASRTRLLINDDIGLCARWNAKEYFSTFIMCADGQLSYKNYKQQMTANTNFSIILCSTSGYYNENFDDMASMGLFDRIVPITVKLSFDTRTKYQKYALSNLNGRHSPKRNPTPIDSQGIRDLSKHDINPRMINNIKYMSKYLTDNEIQELVDVAHANSFKYEV